MKKFASIFMLMLSIVSCSNDDADSRNSSSYYGKWELTKYTTTFILAIYVAGEPQWKEFYDFKSDDTFVKTRIRNGITTTASGTFKTTLIQNQTHLQLTYNAESDIIGSCTGKLNEELFIKEGTLISTWQNCDGPGFEYSKVR